MRNEFVYLINRTNVYLIVLFGQACAMSWSHRYGYASDLLSGKQTTHAAQRTAKSTLTYELGTREFPFLLFCFSILTWKRKNNERATKERIVHNLYRQFSTSIRTPFHHSLYLLQLFLNADRFLVYPPCTLTKIVLFSQKFPLWNIIV